MARRIGIWGGAFDPVHIGHLILAQEAVDACELDHLIWIPTGDPAHKAGPRASAVDRSEMVSLAIQGHPKFSLSTAELDRPGKSYTSATLETVKASYNEPVQLVLLIGADNALDFQNWYQPERVLDAAEVVVLGRSGSPTEKVEATYRDRMHFLKSPLFEVSSTSIRKRLRCGSSIRYLVPDIVRNYIERRSLYSGDRSDGNS
jgi:nicotinate-nucleotide adenylyltransferase